MPPSTFMRRSIFAVVLTCATVVPAAAQQSRPAAGFSFDTCFARCLQQGNSAPACQPRCSERAAILARIPPGAPRDPNDDPRSPRYHDPAPSRPTW